MGQLRGSSATAPAPAPPTTLSQLQQFTDCGCNEGICSCVRSNSSLAEAEGQQQLEQSLLNHTKALLKSCFVLSLSFLWHVCSLRLFDSCVSLINSCLFGVLACISQGIYYYTVLLDSTSIQYYCTMLRCSASRH